jgi:hypothetical protein
MILLIFSFSVITCLSVLIAIKYAGLTKTDTSMVRSAVGGTLAAMIFFLTSVFLAIYYIYVHYLIIVKM